MKISVTSVSAALIASTLSMGTVSQAMDSGGKYEAKGKSYYPVVFTSSCLNKETGVRNYTQIRLGVKKIRWGGDGKTTDARGVEPAITQLLVGDIKVLSNLAKPDIEDGNVVLEIQGKGKISFPIRFGRAGALSKEETCKFF